MLESHSARLGVASLLLVLLGAVASAAAESEPSSVQISYEGQLLQVEVWNVTKLRIVLEQLCEQARAQCELELGGLEADVPPLTITGTWNQVVQQLLQGSRLNYATLAPTAGQIARLVVLGRSVPVDGALAGTLSRADEGAGAGGAFGTGHVAGESLPRSFREGEIGESGAADDDLASAEPDRTSTADPDASWEPHDSDDSAIGGPASAGAGDVRSGSTQDPIHLPPFMGGPPVPSTGEPPGLPFPDENGNPIPLSNQPLTGLPFPDENGNPIPLTPLLPGQQPGSPFPPDTPASSTPGGAPRTTSGQGGVGASPPNK